LPYPNLHDPAGSTADATKAVRSSPRYKDLFSSLWTPGAFAQGHFQPGIKDDPEFAPVEVILQRECPARSDGDDLEASDIASGIEAKLPPGTRLLGYPFLEF
jgi:hypothetical protein